MGGGLKCCALWGLCAVRMGRAGHPLARAPVRRPVRTPIPAIRSARGRASTPGRALRRIIRHLGRVGRGGSLASGRRVSSLGRAFCGLRGTGSRTTQGTFVSRKKGTRSFAPRARPTRRRFGTIVGTVGRGEGTLTTTRRGRGRRGLAGGLNVLREVGFLARSRRSAGGVCSRFGGLRRR